jgi:hypothetical protein
MKKIVTLGVCLVGAFAATDSSALSSMELEVFYPGSGCMTDNSINSSQLYFVGADVKNASSGSLWVECPFSSDLEYDAVIYAQLSYRGTNSAAVSCNVSLKEENGTGWSYSPGNTYTGSNYWVRQWNYPMGTGVGANGAASFDCVMAAGATISEYQVNPVFKIVSSN